MKIGAVNFLNAFPLWWGLENQPGISLIRDIPSRLADALVRRELDTAIISSIEYFKHRDILDYFPDLCISAKGRVESIRLYRNPELDKTDIMRWLRDQEEICFFYDRATRSSLAMLQVLCAEIRAIAGTKFIQIEGPFEEKIERLAGNEALLLIGDPALNLRKTSSIDMGELYWEVFQKSFVYAIWVYRKESGKSARQILLDAYTKGMKNYGKLLDEAVARFNFPADFTDYYFKEIIQYRMNNSIENDMLFFFEKYRRL